LSIASLIDHTLLGPRAGRKEIVKLCAEARKYGFASVCVAPWHVTLCKKLLRGSSVKTCTVIGFPLGASTAECKAFEAGDAVRNGADELDVVINVSALKSGAAGYVLEELKKVRRAARRPKVLKVIIETCYLSRNEKITACRLAKKAGADFVKTSTGFGTGGATGPDVRLMRKTVGRRVGVKASGGIRTLKDALLMIRAGADRIGTSSSVEIAKSENGELNKWH
jgi:deoxyribose-phosphate aldolase